jgi:CHAT domain-containing protein
MRTITLELLRHGPAHNQLLSPLTPYLALCQNHGAVTLHMPFEHNQFLYRLSALGYRINEDSRIFQLTDTARVMGEILAMIPGLTAESNKDDDTDDPLTHLRLILSASELALLPFELALSPNGFPGAGQHLLLQPQTPICLTRETRRVTDDTFRWPKEARVLFVAASPPEVGTIPLESHLLALRRLVGPWVKYYDDNDPEARRTRVEERLYFLPAASIEAIEKACADGRFTHVHILAHGVERKEGYDTRFFLALHDARDPGQTDYISGSRLATALRASRNPDSEGLAQPAVVTLASCNSGTVGSVIGSAAGAGASIAHALHESGIPMVVAGQFPLSFEGSVCLVECLYEGLLWGTDPRRLLYDLRRRLYARFPERHDWSSLTAYVSLPADFDSQLADVRIERAMGSINAAMNHADEVTRRAFAEEFSSDSSQQGQGSPSDATESQELLEGALEKIAAAKRRLQRLVECIPAKRSRIYGNLASTEKRQAEVLYSAIHSEIFDLADEKLEESYDLLRKARDHYWDSFLLNRAGSWAVVQYLSLTLVMQHSAKFPDLNPMQGEKQANAEPEEQGQGPQEQETAERDLDALWSMAHLLSRYDLRSKSRTRNIWACSNLIELYMLAHVMPPSKGRPRPAEASRRALEHTDTLIDLAGRDSFEVYSTRRQVFRYMKWFAEIAPSLEPLRALAKSIFEKFPDDIEEKWK